MATPYKHFPRCYGIQETSRGPGIITDLIRDADGSISKTVRQYVKTNGKTPALRSALERFFDLLQRKLIVTRDVLDHNLVVQIDEAELTIYMIDGFGSTEFVPFSAWVKSLGRRKVNRKIRRCKARYGF